MEMNKSEFFKEEFENLLGLANRDDKEILIENLDS